MGRDTDCLTVALRVAGASPAGCQTAPSRLAGGTTVFRCGAPPVAQAISAVMGLSLPAAFLLRLPRVIVVAECRVSDHSQTVTPCWPRARRVHHVAEVGGGLMGGPTLPRMTTSGRGSPALTDRPPGGIGQTTDRGGRASGRPGPHPPRLREAGTNVHLAGMPCPTAPSNHPLPRGRIGR